MIQFNSSNEKILISRTDNIGDVVLTVPLTGVLKSIYPEIKISFLGQSYTRPVIECCEHVDEFASWDDIEILPPKERVIKFKSYKATCIVHVFPHRVIAQLARQAGIPFRIGTNHRWYHWLYCNKMVALGRKNSSLHESQLNLRLLGILGAEEQYDINEIPRYYGFNRIKPLDRKFMAMLSPSKFNLIIHPKSKRSAKEWHLKNYYELIKVLPKDKFKIFITGTQEDSRSIEKNIVEEHSDAVNLIGQMTLDVLISFIYNADGLLAASTGPLHLAAALGKYALGLYDSKRPIHPQRWRPVGKRAQFLTPEIDDKDKLKENSRYIQNIPVVLF